jgi:hypothetical protein
MRELSMPSFPGPGKIPSREEAINSVLSSIAMEEAALSHIINAEGEKIQFALTHLKTGGHSDMKMMLDINESAAEMLEQVKDIQLLLVNKLNKILTRLPKTTGLNGKLAHSEITGPPKPCPHKTHCADNNCSNKRSTECPSGKTFGDKLPCPAKPGANIPGSGKYWPPCMCNPYISEYWVPTDEKWKPPVTLNKSR